MFPSESMQGGESMTIQELIIRLATVAVIGLLIGLERQIGGHHIEIKTTFLIAVGTFSFCLIEILLGYPDIRMSANIVTGIGFLCSGVIFKNGFTVNGLNTSATLWSTAGISILVAYGYFKYAFVITLSNVIVKAISPESSKTTLRGGGLLNQLIFRAMLSRLYLPASRTSFTAPASSKMADVPS